MVGCFVDTRPGLEEALGFSDDDLAANRRGEVSEEQRARIETTRAAWQSAMDRSRPAMIGMGVVGLGAAVALAIYGLVRGQHLVEMFSIAGVMAASGAVTVRYPGMFNMSVPPAPTRVEIVEGAATLGDEEGVGWGAGILFVRIGGHKFDVGGARVAFVKGGLYRCYYVTSALTIVGRSGLLSAEALPSVST